MTPEELERLARQLDDEGVALARAGDVAGGAARMSEADRLRELASRRGLRGKRGRVYSANEVMNDSHRAALGTSRVGHSAKFRAWIANQAGRRAHRAYSLRGLAEAAGTSPSALSQAQRPKTDPLARPVRPSVARTVERLTGWPADDAHWPAGFQDE